MLNYNIDDSKFEEILSNTCVTGYKFTQILQMIQEITKEKNYNHNLFTNRSLFETDEKFMCLDFQSTKNNYLDNKIRLFHILPVSNGVK